MSTGKKRFILNRLAICSTGLSTVNSGDDSILCFNCNNLMVESRQAHADV